MTVKRARTISWSDPKKQRREVLSAISGLEYLKAIKTGEIEPPPVARLVGYRIVDVEEGYAVFALDGY